MSVLRKGMSVKIIETLVSFRDHGRVNKFNPHVLLLAATGTAPVSFADFAAQTAPAWK
jgi:hypothetical protein